MTARQRFWLKVAVAVTCPLWVLPVAIIGILWMLGTVVWMAASEIVEPSPRYYGNGKQAP